MKFVSDGKRSNETQREYIKACDDGWSPEEGPGRGGLLSVGQPVLARRDVAPRHDDRTVGVEIHTWKPNQGGVLEFSLWDFAGQRQYHATHELYFSPRALYVLCWDMGASPRGRQGLRKEFFLPERSDAKGLLCRDSDGDSSVSSQTYQHDTFDESSDDEDEDNEEAFRAKVEDSEER